MSMARSKITPISVRFEPGWKELVEREAKADMRSAASWVEKIVVDHLRSKGLEPKEVEPDAG